MMGNFDNLTFEELKELYQQTMSEEERAELEDAIYRQRPKTKVYRGGIVGFAKVELGGERVASARRRQYIFLTGGKTADFLWKNIDHDGMPLSTAEALLQTAKKRSFDDKTPIEEVIVQVVDEYKNKDGYIQVIVGDKSHKRKTQSQSIRETIDGPKSSQPSSKRLVAKKSESKPKPEKPERVKSTKGKSKRGDIWKKARGAIYAIMIPYIAERLNGADVITVSKAQNEFIATFDVFLSDVQNRLGAIPKDGIAQLIQVINRRKLIEACKWLGMSAPKTGQPVDLQMANRKKKALARTYHPDVNKDKSTQPLYQKSIESYRVCEQYNESLEPITMESPVSVNL